ncbi:TonB-dependent receptor [bacterium]|nr:TonB-dependent receptor [bacterium]
MRVRTRQVLSWLMIMTIILTTSLWSGTTGKIAGIVVDKQTGDPLAGANILIEDTELGAAADLEGQYTILHVPPGTYNLNVSVIGYAKITVQDIRVKIDQTARVDVALTMEAIEGETVTIVAEKNPIKRDVATSVVAVSAQELAELPVSDIQSVVGLQAGIQSNLQIRGGTSDEAMLQVDGVTLRDPRNNKPVSSVALSAIKEISIERGGFNAEYGQVRSGIVNVVTQEGSKSAYHGSIETRYSPPAPKHFDKSPFDKDSYFLKPYYDDDVCWTGTDNGAWDEYTQRQYLEFEGWNAVSERLMTDNDPTNNLTPIGAQRQFMWETRKQPPLDEPDYVIDGGLGGPIPFLGEILGNPRFFASYRREREMLLFPLTRDDYVQYDLNLKITSDISESMRLQITGLAGKQYTHMENWLTWDPSQNWYMRYPWELAQTVQDRPGNMFNTGAYSLADISHQSLAGKFTHTLNPKTFYEVSLEHFVRKYRAKPMRRRNEEKIYEILPGYLVNEAPFGYKSEGQNSEVSGMFMGGHYSKSRDNTTATSTTLNANLTSQINFSNLVKTGVEVVYYDLDMNYGTIQSLGDGTKWSQHIVMRKYPVRAAVYLQDKLETKEFIMNVGLRLDYSNSNSNWWNIDPYDNSFISSKYDPENNYQMIESKGQWQLSPRLGISHPITENSKLFFNYGHFKQIPAFETMYRVGRSEDNILTSLGDPNLTLAKTISYELGYDHTLLDNYLLQLAAFYQDVSNQQNFTQYTSLFGTVYNKTTNTSYEDIRGFELTLRKNRGRWWTFFANYTYQVTTSGQFGVDQRYQDPLLQKDYTEATVNLYQQRPIPRPYARLNLSLFTPDNYGPSVLGIYPAGGYLLNMLLNWQAGEWETYNPDLDPTVQNNVQRTDYFNSVLRFSKTFQFKKVRVQAFVDIDNLFNYRRMSMVNWEDNDDRNYYYESLHLPESDDYENIPGDDRVGSYRKRGVEFQPIEIVGNIDENTLPKTGLIYYSRQTERYLEYIDDTWVIVNPKRIDKILEDKAYIDMPNQDCFSFLDPRQIYYGLRVSFDLH